MIRIGKYSLKNDKNFWPSVVGVSLLIFVIVTIIYILRPIFVITIAFILGVLTGGVLFWTGIKIRKFLSTNLKNSIPNHPKSHKETIDIEIE